MEGEGIAEALVESARAVYEYVQDMQFATDPPLGVSSTEVVSYEVGDGFAVLRLESALQDTSGLMLMVDGSLVDEEGSGFTRYDEISRTIVARPGEDVLAVMRESSPRVRVVSDLKFLISSAGEFYRRYGDLLAMPEPRPVPSSPRYPEGSDPSPEQEEAVRTVLRSGTCYVWGAPGTGKTQYVLATCIRALFDAGRRVAVFAPTNNSVEQVLRGILRAFADDPSVTGGIVRVGVPSSTFLREHPGMCEDRQAQRRMEGLCRSIDMLEEVMYERACDVLEWEVLDLRARACRRPPDGEGRVMLIDNPDLAEPFASLSGLLSMRPATRELASSAVRRDFRDVMGDVVSELYCRGRPAADLEEYSGWSDADLLSEIMEMDRERRELSATTAGRIGKARIVAATPQQFMSRFRPRGTAEDGRLELDVDHIFLDEACYCGLVNALSLFTNGVPVTFLGDHMQLPPVSQLDDSILRESASGVGRLRYGFLWNMSALYCEGAFEPGVRWLAEAFCVGSPPMLRRTARADLTQSHRFGQNLASVLDRFVYCNGMSGRQDGGDLEILCIDAVCQDRDGRGNRPEAEAVRRFLDRECPDPSGIAILSPYTAQTRMLRSAVGRAYRDCVSTVHGSQGREWDTVVLSVADNGTESREVPYRFTSSSTEMGLRVVNTAVSRARRRLIIVCDREFWMDREGELIGGILREVPPEDVEVFNRRSSGRA